jgi:hypothetical protein
MPARRRTDEAACRSTVLRDARAAVPAGQAPPCRRLPPPHPRERHRVHSPRRTLPCSSSDTRLKAVSREPNPTETPAAAAPSSDRTGGGVPSASSDEVPAEGTSNGFAAPDSNGKRVPRQSCPARPPCTTSGRDARRRPLFRKCRRKRTCGDRQSTRSDLVQCGRVRLGRDTLASTRVRVRPLVSDASECALSLRELVDGRSRARRDSGRRRCDGVRDRLADEDRRASPRPGGADAAREVLLRACLTFPITTVERSFNVDASAALKQISTPTPSWDPTSSRRSSTAAMKLARLHSRSDPWAQTGPGGLRRPACIARRSHTGSARSRSSTREITFELGVKPCLRA